MFLVLNLVAQKNQSSEDKLMDSLIIKLSDKLSKEQRSALLSNFKDLSGKEKEQMIELLKYMAFLPKSSQKLMEQNMKLYYDRIFLFKEYIDSVFAKEYQIRIAFDSLKFEGKKVETFDVSITRVDPVTGYYTYIINLRNCNVNSPNIDDKLKGTFIDKKLLFEIRSKLKLVNCVSIYRYEYFELGFSRNGFDLYSYLLFDKELTKKEIENYLSYCSYRFYDKKVLLKYSGASINSDCFPD